jgi:pilus assembly protein Flp/PilA
MGEAQGFARGRLSHARGRLAAYPHAARPVVSGLIAHESGATAIEYALVAGMIALAIITAVTQLGSQLNVLLGTLAADI